MRLGDLTYTNLFGHFLNNNEVYLSSINLNASITTLSLSLTLVGFYYGFFVAPLREVERGFNVTRVASLISCLVFPPRHPWL